jgi:hypothetical protein
MSDYFALARLVLAGFFFGLSGLGSGVAWRIFRKASSNECGASVKGLPLLPAGLGLSRFISSHSSITVKSNHSISARLNS